MISLYIEVIYLAIGIPSLIFYVILIVSLLRHSNKEVFGRPFYRIFAVICAVDCLSYVTNTISTRFALCPTFNFLYDGFNSAVAARILHSVVFFCSYFLTFGQSLITVNRFTAVTFPLKHHKFWRKHYIHCIAMALFLAIAFSGYLVISEAHFNKHDIEGTDLYFFTFFMDDITFSIMGQPLMLTSIIAISISTLGVLFQLTLNSITLVVLIRKRKTINQTESDKQLLKTEVNLFIISLAMFLISFTMAAYNFTVTVLLFMESELIVGFIDNYLWVSDLNNLSPPYLLCFVSASARRAVFEMFGLKKPKENATVQLFSRTMSSNH
ncbi:hypothetical protein QR680_007930 [Steinernema hermaphroditum]|uniref:Serpentine receptor class gamma n=1 Tax=Steinernema hermaphroditum TaxID=289476 RepID=A0AA39IH59_9BILA|nr:hypothetical protein QR680_007930 [Steinernema hermaphroditum]